MGRCKKFILMLVFVFLSGTYVFAEQVDSYRLSLDEATRLALTNNFDIQIAKYDAWVARTKNMGAKSIYDLVASAEASYQDNQRKQTSTIFGTKVVDNNYKLGLKQKLPTGTALSVEIDNNRSSTDSAFATTPLIYDSIFRVEVQQDLGKNLFGIQDRGEVKLTLLEVANSEFTSLDRIENSVLEVQKAYWDLVLQYENVTIEEDMLVQAKKLYKLNQDKLKDGLVEKPDALASEANYLNRGNELKLANNLLKQKANVLKILLNIVDDQVEIVPVDNFIVSDFDEQLEASLKEAFDNRQDYRIAKNNIESKDINLSMKKNNLWPEINLSATLEKNGLADSFEGAVTNIHEEDNPNLMAMISVEIPLQNRKARAQKKAAVYEKAKELVSIKKIEREIAINVMDRVRNVNVFKEVVQSSVQIANIQRAKLAEEEKRFSRGRSDTDTIVRFQEDSLLARARAATAKHQYMQAKIDLQKNKGTLLKLYWDGEL